METGLLSSIGKMQLTDAGKLLLLFNSAKLGQVSIEEQDIDNIVFLLKAKQLIPFDYALRLKPLPHSPRLHEDIYGLIQTHDLAKTSPIYITEKGYSWVKSVLEYHEYTEGLLEPIVQEVKNLVAGSRDHLFRLVYAEITR